jgi:hypothetical protein
MARGDGEMTAADLYGSILPSSARRAQGPMDAVMPKRKV